MRGEASAEQSVGTAIGAAEEAQPSMAACASIGLKLERWGGVLDGVFTALMSV